MDKLQWQVLPFFHQCCIYTAHFNRYCNLELQQTHLGCVLNGLESWCDLLNIHRYPRFTTALNQIWRIITHLIKFCFILSQTQDQTLKKIYIYSTIQPCLPWAWHIYITLISYTNKQDLPQVYIEAFVSCTSISAFNTPPNTNIIAWKTDTWQLYTLLLQKLWYKYMLYYHYWSICIL